MKILKKSEIESKKFEYFESDKNLDYVRKILSDIKKNRDSALKRYTQKFDSVSLKEIKIQKKTIKNAYSLIDQEMITALKKIYYNIKRFAEKQKEQFVDFKFQIVPGVFTGQRVISLERIGVYVPGGNYPLISTLLMGAVPAVVAGVKEVVVCTPPRHRGKIHPAILVAADIAGVKEIYTVGGIQAIGAMAYGTETIRPVDKIVGPGNLYVSLAKKLVYGQVGIDFIAGPSEIIIIADRSANPSLVAGDLIAQAEHDVESKAVLITTSRFLAKSVKRELEKQMDQLQNMEIAKTALQKNSYILLVDSISEAIQITNKKSPEHIELQVKNPEKYHKEIKNFGALFIGSYSAEVFGDYSSGLNHILPTNGAARFTGGLGVKDFLKIQTTLEVTKEGINRIAPQAQLIAQLEGLFGHANSIKIRMDEKE